MGCSVSSKLIRHECSFHFNRRNHLGLRCPLYVLFILLVIAAIFYRKSLNMLSSKSGVGMFSTAGLLLLIGAVLTIIVIGVIVVWIAMILLAVAFFSIKPATAQATQSTSPPPSIKSLSSLFFIGQITRASDKKAWSVVGGR